MGVITDDNEPARVPYKGPINQPCSACSGGDYLMQHHDHDYVKPENRRGSVAVSDTYITPVLLLCAECRQPIKATITTAQWLKVEWIGPDGQCLACYQRQKEQRNYAATNNQDSE